MEAQDILDSVTDLAGTDNPVLLAGVLMAYLAAGWAVVKRGYALACWLAPGPSDLCSAIRDALEDGPVKLSGVGDFQVSAGKVSVDLNTSKIETQECDSRGCLSDVCANELLSPLDRRRVIHAASAARERVLTRRKRDRKRKAAVMVAAWREDRAG